MPSAWILCSSLLVSPDPNTPDTCKEDRRDNSWENPTTPRRPNSVNNSAAVFRSFWPPWAAPSAWEHLEVPLSGGRHGGAAFIVVYLIALLVGPVLMTEYAIGRKTGASYTTALKKLLPGKKWYLLVLSASFSGADPVLLLRHRGLDGGLSLKSITGAYNGMSGEEITTMFGNFTANPFQMILWLGHAAHNLHRPAGRKGGIEKVCNVLLPSCSS